VARESHLLPIGRSSRAVAIRRWITGTLAGRALAAGAIIKTAAFLLSLAAPQAAAVGVIDTIGDIALVAGAATLAYRVFGDARRRLLWRVRRKLTISYIFIGFVPVLLIITFFALCGALLLNNISAYLIHSRVRELVAEAQLLAEMAAVTVDSRPSVEDMRAALIRRQAMVAGRYPQASYALVHAGGACGGAPGDGQRIPLLTAGPWAHATPPASVPEWVPCEGLSLLTFFVDESRREGDWAPGRLTARAVAWLEGAATSGHAVILDVPISAEVTERFEQDSGIELLEMGVVTNEGGTLVGSDAPAAAPEGARAREIATAPAAAGGLLRTPMEWVAFFDWTDWSNGEVVRPPLTVRIRTNVVALYERLTPVERIGTLNFGQVLLLLLATVAGLFLIILSAAFLMGLGLARSITGAVHELFVGTERVRRGDFSHKIAVRTRDQLGELASSFNSMIASIEDLLHQKAEKERLAQELRIARSIQMSLLPQSTLVLPGIGLMAHCEPAREVGGDYYDFLPIDGDALGILIADVSGKGTSAALYMAELKGIVLSLSQLHSSPRQLLIDANRIISRHLDSRSFITVSYLLVDLKARTLRYSRAGHCPMIFVPGPYSLSRDPQILTPDGMVLGLTLDDGTMFNSMLEEMTVPLRGGDLFLLYTDGMSEAMNAAGDLFGDSRLASLVHQHADLPSDELLARILEQVSSFAESTVQQDDMTMVVIRVEESGSMALAAT
jgi:sigma-B regulation protein RsbU (phosphoserine phosphatase)